MIEKDESSSQPEVKYSVRNSAVRNVVSEKVVSVRDMSDVDGKIEELMEKREGRYYVLPGLRLQQPEWRTHKGTC